MTTLLVTGGAGFIGSNFIFHMRKAHPEYRVVCMDCLTYAGNAETLKNIPRDEHFRFTRTDIRNRDAVFRVFREESPDMVVNFAAESHVDRSIKDPQIFLDTNIIGTSVLMDACLMSGVDRFHQVSTDEIYGDLPIDRPDLLFTEGSLLRPSSPYSSSKAGADLLVMAYERTYGLPATISRCSNNYGPYQFPEKLIPLMISKALRREPLPLYGDGLNVRDWLYVGDHCSAIDLILHSSKSGEVYNVGGHNERSNIDVVRTILSHMGLSDGSITFVEDRKGHDRRYAICPDKITHDLGWSPKVCFDDGIRRTVDWYVSNRGWCDHILNGEYLEFNRSVQ